MRNSTKGIILIAIGLILYFYIPDQITTNYMMSFYNPQSPSAFLFFNNLPGLYELSANVDNIIAISQTVGIILAIAGFIIAFR